MVVVLGKTDGTSLQEILILGFYFLSIPAKNKYTNVGNFLEWESLNMPIFRFLIFL